MITTVDNSPFSFMDKSSLRKEIEDKPIQIEYSSNDKDTDY